MYLVLNCPGKKKVTVGYQLVRGRTVLLEVALAFRMCSPWHQYPYSSYSFLYIPFGTDKENLFKKQSFLGWWSFPLISWPWPLNPQEWQASNVSFQYQPQITHKYHKKNEKWSPTKQAFDCQTNHLSSYLTL